MCDKPPEAYVLRSMSFGECKSRTFTLDALGLRTQAAGKRAFSAPSALEPSGGSVLVHQARENIARVGGTHRQHLWQLAGFIKIPSWSLTLHSMNR